MRHGTILTMSLIPFWVLNVVVVVLSLEAQKALGFNQKYLNSCSEYEQRSYGFKTTRGWVIKNRIFIFGWTVSLMSSFWYQYECLCSKAWVGSSQFYSSEQASWLCCKQAWWEGVSQCSCSSWAGECSWSFDSWRSEGDVRFLLNYARSAGRETGQRALCAMLSRQETASLLQIKPASSLRSHLSTTRRPCDLHSEEEWHGSSGH